MDKSVEDFFCPVMTLLAFFSPLMHGSVSDSQPVASAKCSSMIVMKNFKCVSINNKVVIMENTLNRHRPIYSRGWFMALMIFALLLVVLRIVVPTLAVAIVNKRLSSESPNFAMKIGDLDLHLLKGHYIVKDINGTMKSTGEEFLHIDTVATSVPWKELFKGKVVTDVRVSKLDLAASQALLDTAKAEGERIKQKYVKEEKEEKVKKETKLFVRSFRMENSDVTIHDFMSFKGKDTRKVSDINLLVTNVVPTKNSPDTDFKLTANVFGPAPLKVWGVAKLNEKPLAWDANAVIKNFDLKSIDPIVQEKVQASIRKGKLDEYIEAKSSGGVITGYMKPFVSKLKIDPPKGGFKMKGKAAAAGGKMVEVLLTDSEGKTLATEVPFKYTDKVEIEVLPVLTKAVENRTNETIKPGIENKIQLDEESKQAEEAK